MFAFHEVEISNNNNVWATIFQPLTRLRMPYARMLDGEFSPYCKGISMKPIFIIFFESGKEFISILFKNSSLQFAWFEIIFLNFSASSIALIIRNICLVLVLDGQGVSEF